jgi:uncharacterized Fe-S cluster protein YjdI
MRIFMEEKTILVMDKTNIIKKYSNGEITIVWKPATCIHSAICWKQPDGLPAVFNPAERPWIKPKAADTETLIKHVKKCPSGALSIETIQDISEKSPQIMPVNIEMIANGPIMIKGNHCIVDNKGDKNNKTENSFLCRCGASANKPYCDGSHSKIGFIA